MRQRSGEQRIFDARVVDFNDSPHGVHFWKLDIVKKAPPKKCVGQFFLIVRCYDDDWPVSGFDQLVGFIDMKFHFIKLLQEIIWKFDISFVNFVDQ